MADAAGGGTDDPNKQDPLDAVLWQRAAAGEPGWPSPWGSGRPGWHAGCTAMAMTVLGNAVDLHAGGSDLRFPHHAYEAAQAEAASGVTPFARAWMHIGTVSVDGAKMAKSTGNLLLVRDLLERVPPAVLRLALLDRAWAQQWKYDDTVLTAATAAVRFAVSRP